MIMHLDNFINGRFVGSANGERFAKLEPATGQPMASVAASSLADVDAAVQAARAAFDSPWRMGPASERARALLRLADLVERDTEVFVDLLSREQGRAAFEIRMMDVPITLDTLRYFAGWADKLEGRTIPTAGSMGRATLNYTELEPLGVIAQIIPWNAPLMICAWKLAPALATGCTVVIKPSEDAPVALTHLMTLVAEAAIPDGVVNLVHGIGPTAGRALATHADVARLSFTGSTDVGRSIARELAGTFRPLTLELGGKAAQIVFDDADLPRTIEGLMIGLYANQGQTCAAGSRILVHRSIYRAVADQLAAASDAIVVGDPRSPHTQMGALINQRHQQRVLGYIERGLQEGAQRLSGERDVPAPGFFVAPTLFASDDAHGTLAQQEIFGPVGVIIPFDDDDQAIAIANSTVYALSASLWTQDLSRAHRLARRVEVGAVAVNA